MWPDKVKVIGIEVRIQEYILAESKEDLRTTVHNMMTKSKDMELIINKENLHDII